MTPAPATPALTGVRVLELGTLIAGPFCGRLLADQGADVIKIEAPDRPDPLRDWGQAEVDGHHFFWTVHARNKRCITLDLRSDRGRELLLELVDTADVVLESFRPGTLEKWGIGPDVLRARNPRLVVARVSGYGQTGPHSRRPGYASVAEAVSGMRHLNGFPDGPPPRTALSIGDSLAGMFAMQGVLTALFARDRDGGLGQVVDVSLAESCLALLESTIPDYSATGLVRGPGGTRLEGLAPSNLYRCADNRWLIIAANQDTVFARLCAAMGRGELVDDPRFATHTARGRHQDEIDAVVGEWAAQHDADALTDILETAGVVVGPVNTVAEVVQDPQFLARDMLVAHHDEALDADVLGPGVIPKLDRTPGSVRWAGSPRPGTHNTEVYTGLLGLSDDELGKLVADRIV
ncbi:CoA transferase [Pseudonocardia sp. 73-21]|uniref:CaiB/BaiF CoA transferase family protein n=1 Tax=Pseudonocardia sp. 73-21 TaxID=1895809 RepID=UPI000961F89A|nr:CoA transferase [Pseudonocardia sp. 73-21]OJY40941.1 MAG: formyl-CoA transferase [Pseudonocardia sp. 73-21]